METARVTPYRVKYHFYDDESNSDFVSYFDTYNEMMNWVCHQIAFDDINSFVYDEIKAGEKTMLYMGWRPGMFMLFVNAENPEEVMWGRSYPEYDH